MIQGLIHSIITFLDLVALTTIIGASWSLLWMAGPAGRDAASSRLISDRLYRLLTVCLPAIAISSVFLLVQRSIEMSGFGIKAIMPVLPAVVLKSHYGRMWFVRLAGVLAAGVLLWLGRRKSASRLYAALLLLAGSGIAFSRSASGHAADFGDLSAQQLADWMHLIAVSSWGGALLAIAFAVPPSFVAEGALKQRVAAGMADRFYVLFGPVLAVLVLTGLYSARFEVGSFQALVTTSYGRMLSVKLALFLLLAFRYIAPPGHGREEGLYAMKFLRRTRFEAIVVLVLLLCVALLVHKIPARHQSHLEHQRHEGHHTGQYSGQYSGLHEHLPEQVVGPGTSPAGD